MKTLEQLTQIQAHNQKQVALLFDESIRIGRYDLVENYLEQLKNNFKFYNKYKKIVDEYRENEV